MATDGAGSWVAVWYSNDSLGETIGSDFDILVSAVGLPPEEILDPLESLLSHRVLVEADRGAFSFYHHQVRQVILESIRRWRIHRHSSPLWRESSTLDSLGDGFSIGTDSTRAIDWVWRS